MRRGRGVVSAHAGNHVRFAHVVKSRENVLSRSATILFSWPHPFFPPYRKACQTRIKRLPYHYYSDYLPNSSITSLTISLLVFNNAPPSPSSRSSLIILSPRGTCGGT